MANLVFQCRTIFASGTARDQSKMLRRLCKTALSDPEFRVQTPNALLDVIYVSLDEAEKVVIEVVSKFVNVQTNFHFFPEAH